MSNETPDQGVTFKSLLFNENGKFCLPCTLYKSFQYISGTTGKSVTSPAPIQEETISKQSTALSTLPSSDLIPGSRTYVKEDPPDVNKLGSASWTFLHAVAAKYPEKPTPFQQEEMSDFLNIFSHVYPCFWCAKDFEKYIKENAPNVKSQEELSIWMCQAHNKVNKKLGKAQFNCDFWKARWKDGWDEQ
ncbi:similar to Saccharomyces cerevisiae YGR029W ERV1 Flavin-linked sulfhydryl oxidase of the mitochondrial intermembrane space (IMS) [Maudiozyma saulgeensis]|uniref:Sulfhydryl oxidase n=1 Tax=Maudiozyma saulgeensis TaxID=1789683 RepID=A0A1X7RA49_9SACH|nr:similar to Saccharomyces cerevisiae YGR029W ERV1 Flavin-linked sulfhydryl oxidase of the mitochondrial intermembrane space (IMS) [Kazachstania saulgeensis]